MRLFLAFAIASFCSPLFGAVTLTVDLDTQTDGVQSVIDVMEGDVLRVGIILDIGEIPGTTGVLAYNFNVQFDDTELALGPNVIPDSDESGNPILSNAVRTPPYQLISTPPFVRTYSNIGDLAFTSSSIENIAAGNFDPANPFVIKQGFSQLVFEFSLVATQANADSVLDVTPFVKDGEGFLVSDESVVPPIDTILTPIVIGGTVNVSAVPEPTTLLACTFGLGVVAMRCRRSSRRRSPANIN